MARLRAALNEGPPGSRVERVGEEPFTQAIPDGFEITG
jgi:hypothetical protein